MTLVHLVLLVLLLSGCTMGLGPGSNGWLHVEISEQACAKAAAFAWSIALGKCEPSDPDEAEISDPEATSEPR